MSGPGTGVPVYLACGVTDMRKGIEGLAALAQDQLSEKPDGGAVLSFRSRRGDRFADLVCIWIKRDEDQANRLMNFRRDGHTGF